MQLPVHNGVRDCGERMNIQELIVNLNGDLAREYMAALQYLQHRSMINGVYFAFAKELEDHAGEEIEHSKTLSDYIQYLGGVPVATPLPAYTASEAIAMLRQDLNAENDAIARYTERVKQAQELGQYGLAVALQNILKEENMHANDLMTILRVPS